MLPSPSFCNVRHVRGTYSELAPYGSFHRAIRDVFTDGSYVVGGELGVRVLHTHDCPPLPVTIRVVIGGRASKQMGGVEASSVVARVTDLQSAVDIETQPQGSGESVYQQFAPLNTDGAVTAWTANATRPIPTPCIGINGAELHQPLHGIVGDESACSGVGDRLEAHRDSSSRCRAPGCSSSAGAFRCLNYTANVRAGVILRREDEPPEAA